MNLLERLQSKIENLLQKMEKMELENMELREKLARTEQGIEAMPQKMEELELENMELREELVKTKQDKQEAMESIDNLLQRLQQVKCPKQADK